MKAFLIPLISLALLSCSNQEQETYELKTIKIGKEYPNTSLSQVSEYVNIIPLGTTEDLLLARIANIALGESDIIISDIAAVYRFNREGKLLNRIGSSGQGPGEFDLVKSLAVDWDNEQVFVAADFKLMTFDLKGTLIQEAKAASLIESINVTKEGLQVIFPSFGQNKSANGKLLNEVYLVDTDQSFKLKDSIVLRSVEVDKMTGVSMHFGQTYLSKSGSNEYVYFPVPYTEPLIRDTLYQLKEGRLVPHLRLDLGIKNKEERRLSLSNIVKTKNYIFSNFGFDRKARQLLHHLKSGNNYQAIEGFKDDIHGTGIASLIPLNTQENLFYFSKEGIELEGIIAGATADDNPYLFIVKLKE